MTSRYAMQRYVADQVERLPWDLSVYQTAEVPLAGQAVGGDHLQVAGVAEAKLLYFLRTMPPYSLRPIIDGQPLRSPWISLLTSDRADAHSARHPAQRPRRRARPGRIEDRRWAMPICGCRTASDSSWSLEPRDKNEARRASTSIRTRSSLTTPIERVIRIDATEINRWFLEQTSSPTLVPELGLILVTPWNRSSLRNFDGVVARVHPWRAWRTTSTAPPGPISPRSSIWCASTGEPDLGLGH